MRAPATGTRICAACGEADSSPYYFARYNADGVPERHAE